MFSPFSMHLVIIVMRTKIVFWFLCLRQRLRAFDVARILVALFPYLFSYKFQARSFERPAGIIVKLPRSLSDTTFGMIWSFDRILLRKQSLKSGTRAKILFRDSSHLFPCSQNLCTSKFEMFGIMRKRCPRFLVMHGHFCSVFFFLNSLFVEATTACDVTQCW